ncbi:hypothetical protein [Spongiactinospora rosea]|nr:hypothetical protein [Spongiactinospora rosea]
MAPNGSAVEGLLSQYVQEYMVSSGCSARELAKRATDPKTGLKLAHTYISAIVGGEVARVPDLWRLRALANALSVDDPGGYTARLDQIKAASARQWLDLQVTSAPDDAAGAITVPVDPRLSDAARRRILRGAMALAEAEVLDLEHDI